jgi:hypothetical protein
MDSETFACASYNYDIISGNIECINLADVSGIEPETAAAVVANCPETCNYCPHWQRWGAKPTDASHARALEYACADGAGACVDLVSSYIVEEWGANFASAQWLSSSCDSGVAIVECALPGVSAASGAEEFSYVLPPTSNTTCCAATEVIVAYYRELIREQHPDHRLFSCPLGDDVLDVKCGARDENGTRIDGSEEVCSKEAPCYLCKNDCALNDDWTAYACDDGGVGFNTDYCKLGHDCRDCGPRPITEGRFVCADACPSAGNGICEDGGIDSASFDCAEGTDCSDCGTRHLFHNGPFAKPDDASFERAVSLMCAIPSCGDFVELVVHKEEHLRGKYDFENRDLYRHGHGDYDVYGQGYLGLHGYLSVTQLCSTHVSGTEMCLAGSLYFLAPKPSSLSDRSSVFEMSCCAAANILFGEWAWQGVATPGIAACDNSIHPFCDNFGRVDDALLHDAKAYIAADPACFAVLDDVVQKEQALPYFPAYVLANNPLFRGIDSATFHGIIHEDHSCWSRLSETPLLGLPQIACTAVDVWTSWTMWKAAPFLATKFYPECVKSSAGFNVTCGTPWGQDVPVPDDRSFAEAQSILCSQASELHLSKVQAHWSKAGLPEVFSTDTICGDPCRCSAGILQGCGFHNISYGRPFCYVANPAQCDRAVDSDIMPAEKWLHCPVGYDTCQPFVMDDPKKYPCMAFVERGPFVFVPEGETLESMQTVQNVATSIDVEGVQNELAAWLLSASFDSSECYTAVGEFICNSIFLRCEMGDSAASQLECINAENSNPRPRPLRLCKDACTQNDELRAYR